MDFMGARVALKATRQFFVFLYNQVIPCLMVTLGIISVWLLARSLEVGVFDWLMRQTANQSRPPVDPVHLVLVDEAVFTSLQADHDDDDAEDTRLASASVAWLGPLVEANPALVVFTTPFHTTQRLLQRAQQHLTTPQWQWLQQHHMAGVPLQQQTPYRDQRLHQLSPDNALAVLALDSELPDGLVRTARPFWETRPTAPGETWVLQPDLSLAAVLRYLNIQQFESSEWQVSREQTPWREGVSLTLFPTRYPHQRLSLPVDATGRYLLRWYRPSGVAPNGALLTHAATTASQLPMLSPQTAQSRFKNRIIVVGTATFIQHDHYPTPLVARHAGADVVATTINNIINTQTLVRSPSWLRAFSLLAAFFLAFILRLRLESFGRAALYTLAFMVAYFWLCLYALVRHAVVLDMITPEVFLVMGLVAGSVWWSTNRDRQLLGLEKTLSQLVSPSVFRQIQRQRKGLVPGGQRLEITSLFVDIRNFTTLAENMPTLEVTDLLNAFYTQVEQVTFRHQGTIDKYMGDGVLVMFGAPLQAEDHADMGVLAAVDLLDSLRQLSQQWWQERSIQFDVGISLNSGHAYVGFLGPVNKLEYTAVGDVVNLCVRLQLQNKQFGVSLVLSEATMRLCYRALAQHPVLSLGSVRVPGREGAVTVYTLASLQQELTEEGRQAAQWAVRERVVRGDYPLISQPPLVQQPIQDE